jgi:hypothetical protein
VCPEWQSGRSVAKLIRMIYRLLSQILVVAATLAGAVTAATPTSTTTANEIVPGAVETREPAFESDFTDAPDGAPADPDIVVYGNDDQQRITVDSPAGGLHVLDGALQSKGTTGLAAGYAQVDLGAPVTRIGADFSFPDGGAPGGAIALPVWAEPFQLTWPRLPTAPVHFVLTRDNWAYQGQWDDVTVTVAEGTFVPPLPADAVLTLDLRFAGPTAEISLPDGTVTTVSDLRIASPAQFATFESFRLDAATMASVRILRIWADR